MSLPLVIWDPRMLGYRHPGGQHPMDPLRWELTWMLAGTLGVLDDLQGVDAGSGRRRDVGHGAHRWATSMRCAGPPDRVSPFSVGHGLGTADDPIFPGMHDQPRR